MAGVSRNWFWLKNFAISNNVYVGHINYFERLKMKTKVQMELDLTPVSMAMEIGREAFARGDGDLFYALFGSNLQAEIILAWLERELPKRDCDPMALISMAGHTLDDAEAAKNRC